VKRKNVRKARKSFWKAKDALTNFSKVNGYTLKNF
jgi:hypothetical protein